MKKVRVKTYADMIGKTTTWVYKLIDQGKVKSEKIDGVTFIIVDK